MKRVSPHIDRIVQAEINRNEKFLRTGIPFVKLERETIDAYGVTCSECDAAPKKLVVFYTMRGSNRRTHNGQFCSKLCHDRFHGLKPRVKK